MRFKSKGHIDLDTLVFQNVIGPIGQPADEALYLPVNAADGKPMNAENDYVIKMTKEGLPPALAFWSVTLYDTKNGWFIPNKEDKYSVGQNAGYKLNAEGGIEIFIAAKSRPVCRRKIGCRSIARTRESARCCGYTPPISRRRKLGSCLRHGLRLERSAA